MPLSSTMIRQDVAGIELAADFAPFAGTSDGEVRERGRENPVRAALTHQVGAGDGRVGQAFLDQFLTFFWWNMAKGEGDAILNRWQNRQEQRLPMPRSARWQAGGIKHGQSP